MNTRELPGEYLLPSGEYFENENFLDRCDQADRSGEYFKNVNFYGKWQHLHLQIS